MFSKQENLKLRIRSINNNYNNIIKITFHFWNSKLIINYTLLWKAKIVIIPKKSINWMYGISS